MVKAYWLPGTEPQMALDGSWYQINGPCRACGHPILFHVLAPRWRCQNNDCGCSPKMVDALRPQPQGGTER